MISCFDAIYTERSRLLILGSAPSVKSLEKGQFYGNEQNRFWKILFALFGRPYDSDYEAKKKLITENDMALWDVIDSCERKGSLDADIRNVSYSDIPALVRKTRVENIIVNGGTAEKYFKKANFLFCRNVNVYYLPSTSPANAKMKFEELLDRYKIIKQLL